MTFVSPSRLSDLARLVHREVVLLAALAGIAAGGFLFTQWVAASNRARQSSDASRWFERGRARLDEGRTSQAVTALDRASARQPDDWDYARTLADALVADDQTDAARQLLLRWRLRRPDEAAVNTRLASLEARHGDVRAAVDYASALHGRWRESAESSRLALRRELIAFELQHGLARLNDDDRPVPVLHDETGLVVGTIESSDAVRFLATRDGVA